MYLFKYTLLSIFLFSILNSYSQNEKRSVIVKKISEEIILNGILDEKVWEKADKADEFWQQFPSDSVKATDKTEVKLLYSDTHLYVGVTAYTVGKNYTINSLRRDYSSRNNDNVTIEFETFNDGQNAFLFGVNAFGVQREALISERGVGVRGFNLTWDTKWRSASKNFDNKYVVEYAIPFSSIKYPENSKSWGFQAYRYDFQSNERSIWTNVVQGLFPTHIGFFGEMIFEEPLKKNKTPLYLIPYINCLLYTSPSPRD